MSKGKEGHYGYQSQLEQEARYSADPAQAAAEQQERIEREQAEEEKRCQLEAERQRILAIKDPFASFKAACDISYYYNEIRYDIISKILGNPTKLELCLKSLEIELNDQFVAAHKYYLTQLQINRPSSVKARVDAIAGRFEYIRLNKDSKDAAILKPAIDKLEQAGAADAKVLTLRDHHCLAQYYAALKDPLLPSTIESRLLQHCDAILRFPATSESAVAVEFAKTQLTLLGVSVASNEGGDKKVEVLTALLGACQARIKGLQPEVVRESELAEFNKRKTEQHAKLTASYQSALEKFNADRKEYQAIIQARTKEIKRVATALVPIKLDIAAKTSDEAKGLFIILNNMSSEFPRSEAGDVKFASLLNNKQLTTKQLQGEVTHWLKSQCSHIANLFGTMPADDSKEYLNSLSALMERINLLNRGIQKCKENSLLFPLKKNKKEKQFIALFNEIEQIMKVDFVAWYNKIDAINAYSPRAFPVLPPEPTEPASVSPLVLLTLADFPPAAAPAAAAMPRQAGSPHILMAASSSGSASGPAHTAATASVSSVSRSFSSSSSR